MDAEKPKMFARHTDLKEWTIWIAKDLDLLRECNLIVEMTASSNPLLFALQLRPGTHIHYYRADDIDKQKLQEEIKVG